MPKSLLWIITAIVVVILFFVWSAESKPARITLINQGASTIREVVLTAGANRVEVGALRGGEFRAVTIRPAETLTVTFTLRGETKSWTYRERIRAGASLVLEVTPQGRVRRATPSISSSSSLRQMSAST